MKPKTSRLSDMIFVTANSMFTVYERCLLRLGLAALLMFAHGWAFCAEPQGRDWTNADSIAVRYYGPLIGAWYGAGRNYSPIEVSPDGHYFYVLSARGDPAALCNVATLEVFDSRLILQELSGNSGVTTPLSPLHTIEMRGRTYPLREVTWDEASAAIVFFGTDAGGVEQAYRLEVSSGKLDLLTHDPASFKKYGLQFARGMALFRRSIPISPPERSPDTVIVPARRTDVGDIELRWVIGDSERREWVAVYPKGDPWIMPLTRDMLPGKKIWTFKVWFSPDSERAVIALEEDREAPLFFELVDFVQRQVKPLGEVAAGGQRNPDLSPTAARVLWTQDGKDALIVNIVRPIDTGSDSGQTKEAGYIASYNVESGHWQVIEALKGANPTTTQISGIGWLEKGAKLLITHGTKEHPEVGTVYNRDGDRWIGRTVPATTALPPTKPKGELPDGLRVSVHQNENEPPVVVAELGNHSRALSKPDPALEGVWRAPQEPFTWRMPDGTSVTGGLSLPRGVVKGTRLPLVIQVGEYLPDLFRPDGHLPGPHAHQTLVAHGFAVLEMNYMDVPGRGTPREGPDVAERLDAVVEALAREGIIDPQRVGIIGHSRAGYVTHFTLTHPGRVRFVAAEVVGSWTGSYPQYLQDGATGGPVPGYERSNGGNFWRNKAAWLEHDPLFNADRLETPTLFSETGYTQKLGFEDASISPELTPLIGAYTLAHKPIEFVSFPFGGHVQVAIPERKAQMDLSVDWMRFWIQGCEDPAPGKANQYRRWRQIRARNEQRKAEEALAGAK